MCAKDCSKSTRSLSCPCGGSLLEECCGRFINAGLIPQTALELMRSRYSAYVLRNESYLQATWYGSTRPTNHLLDENANIKWLSLEIKAHEQEGSSALVEFIARFKDQGRAQRLHEISRFVYEDGRWFYLDGVFPPHMK